MRKKRQRFLCGMRWVYGENRYLLAYAPVKGPVISNWQVETVEENHNYALAA
jgi:hypothetical protein